MLWYQIFNLAMYGVVDKVLLQAHILRLVLATSLDMNNFVHVESIYLPRSASGSGPALCSASELLSTLDASHAWDRPTPAKTMRPPSAHPVVPSSTECGIGAEDFNVGEFLVDRTSLVPSLAETRIDQYGSMFEHVAIHQRDSIDEDDTPLNRDAGRQRQSVRVSLACQPSPMDKDKESHEDVDVQGRPQVPFYLQEMDLAANQSNRWPPFPDAMDRSRAPVDDEIALVLATVEGRMVINVSDVESYGSERQLLGDSSNEDSIDDNKGVTQGVEMPSTPERRTKEVDAPSTALTGADPAFAPTVDNFYNAVWKARHPDAIVPKQELDWWVAREERKQRKAQERELAALQLREVQK